jgi:hypothetical protein
MVTYRQGNGTIFIVIVTNRTLTGRLIVMLIIILGIAIIPSQIERFVRLLRENECKKRIFQEFSSFLVYKSYSGSGHVVLFAHRPESVIPWLKVKYFYRYP